MIVFDVYQYLSKNPEIKAMVGGRIYPLKLPQTPAYPAITYFQVSDPGINTKQGRYGGKPRVQISCWAKKYTEAKILAQKVIEAMSKYTKENINVNEFDTYEDEADIYQVPLDFIIWAKE